MRRWITGGVLFAALWMAWAALIFTVANFAGSFGRIVTGLPDVPGVFYGLPIGWALAASALTLVLVALAYVTVGRILTRAERPSFVAGWLAAILAAVVVGAALDLPNLIRSVELAGIRGIITEPYNMQKAVFWAVFAGWMPGLLVARKTKTPSAGGRKSALPMVVIATLVVGAALAAVVVGGTQAAEAQRAQEAYDQAKAAEGAVGAVPDRQAPGIPVPERAERSETAPENACTGENSALLLGGGDAATGHRIQTIELMNFSEAPCVVDGYPDIAFEDQNAHLLSVTIEQGSSFMAADPGPMRIEVPAGGSVTAAIGWDANSTHGALVAHTLHAAVRAGAERGSWPLILDVVEGSTVSLTAWRGAEVSAG